MKALRILSPGMYTTVQDGGRIGYTQIGIPRSGFLDSKAAALTNLLLQKNSTEALLEMIGVGVRFEALTELQFVVQGAECKIKVNGEMTPQGLLCTALKGSIIEIGEFVKGRVAYIGFSGSFNVKKVLDSFSTLSTIGKGGFKGRQLKKNDVLELIELIKIEETGITNSTYYMPNSKPIIRVHKGPEFNRMLKLDIIKSKFSVSNNSNRMAILLDGNAVELQKDEHFGSKPLWPGMIQCTPSGSLVVMHKDGPTTGGYPRVLYVPQKSLIALSQIAAGHSFNFKLVS